MMIYFLKGSLEFYFDFLKGSWEFYFDFLKWSEDFYFGVLYYIAQVLQLNEEKTCPKNEK